MQIQRAIKDLKGLTRGDFHTEIGLGRGVIIDVVNEMPVSCKIRAKNCQPPCKIKFTYKRQGDLNVYAS